MRRLGIVAALTFVATVWAANYAVTHWGDVPVGFGLTAPAGVYFAGVAFTLRDVTHRALGRWAVIAAIIVGAALSYWLGADANLGGPVTLAAASAIAFLVAELVDLGVYEPIRRHGWLPAVAASNVAGLVIDSALFLYLAFGTYGLRHFLAGQVIGKAWMTAAAIVVLYSLQRARKPVPA